MKRGGDQARPAGEEPHGEASPTLDLSVLIPVFNEVENVGPLHAELDAVLRPLDLRYELIFVDDGSIDGTPAALERIQADDPEHVRVAFLWRNCGQTAALSAALDLARGEILVPMDGDRQNDPADIPRLLETLGRGYDVVSGWRKNRHDAFLSRKIPSRIANRLVARISGVPLHDFGCTLKAYRRRVLAGVRLYGEMHRFIPIFAAWQGARVTEQVVNHRPRTAGKTKYGLGRTFNVVLDLILIRFLQRYAQRPIHFFGRIGLWSFALGFVCFLAMLYFKCDLSLASSLVAGRAGSPEDFVETPLPSFAVMFFLAGGMSILLGIQSELIMRTYYESQAKTTYLLREVRQGDGAEVTRLRAPVGPVFAPEVTFSALLWYREGGPEEETEMAHGIAIVGIGSAHTGRRSGGYGQGRPEEPRSGAKVIAERPLCRGRGGVRGGRGRGVEAARGTGAAAEGGDRAGQGRVPVQPGRVRQGDRGPEGGDRRAAQERRRRWPGLPSSIPAAVTGRRPTPR